MKTLIEAVEAWIDERVLSASGMGELEARFKDMEEIHIRDANRIAELERHIMTLVGDGTYDAERATTIESRLDDIEMGMEEKTNSPSPEYNDGEESTVTELGMRLDDMDSRLEDIESILEDKIDISDVEEMIEVAINDIDLESRIIDAVQSEIDSIDFKITVER